MKRYIADCYPPRYEPTDIEDYLNSGPFPGYVVAAINGSQIIWRLDLQAYCHLGGRVDVTDTEVTIYEQDGGTIAKRFRYEYRDGVHIRAIEEIDDPRTGQTETKG